MSRPRKLLMAYLGAVFVERLAAHALVRFDAAGHLLSAGLHTALPIFVAVAFFVVLRVVVYTAWPVAMAFGLLELARALAASRHARSAPPPPTSR